MSASDVPTQAQMMAALRFCHRLGKSPLETHTMLVEAYGEHAIGLYKCSMVIEKIKLKDQNLQKKPKFSKLEYLLDTDVDQSTFRIADQLITSLRVVHGYLKSKKIFQTAGKWVRPINERKQENRKMICQSLIERNTIDPFLHRIVTGGERWMYIENSSGIKSQKLSDDLNKPSTSTANNFTRILFCIWWDAKGLIRYELLRPGETVDIARYQQQMIDLNRALQEKRPSEHNESSKVILLHDNTPVHTSTQVTETISQFGWEILKYPACSPDLSPTYYKIFTPSKFEINRKLCTSYEEVLKWLIDNLANYEPSFYFNGIYNLPKTWEKCISNNGNYIDWAKFYITII